MNQRWFVWLILLLSIAAIPAGYFGRESAAQREESDSDDSSSSLFNTMKYKDRIQVIKLSGMIIDAGDSSSLLSSTTGSARSCMKQLRKALKDDKIKAVLLRINTPGGTVPTSQEINSLVQAVRNKGIPVYTSMSDMAASGGYYVACATDRVFAQPGTLTGSIGVIMNGMNLKGLGDKLGIAPETIKSGKFKDIASPYRPMTPEERQLLQTLIMESYEQFVTAVATGRKMKVDQVKKIADGRIYTGAQAKKLGLVDEMGGYDACLEALQKACMEKYKLDKKLPVDDKTSEGLLSSILDSAADGSLVPGAFTSRTPEDLILQEVLTSRLTRQPLWMVP